MKNILKGKWALDSNIIIYALDRRSPYHESVKNMFAIEENTAVEYYISSQNVAEVLNVLIKQYGIGSRRAWKSLLDFIDAFECTIVYQTITTLNIFHSFLVKSETVDIYDALYAATMMDNGVTNIVTANSKDFKFFKKIVIYNPLKE